MKDLSNARNLEYSTLRARGKNTLPFFWSIADFITSRGPDGVSVYFHRSPQERYYELIFRLLLRLPGRALESWSIFRRDSREWVFDEHHDGIGGTILRKSSWDGPHDKENRTWEISLWPSITNKHLLYSAWYCKGISRENDDYTCICGYLHACI